MFLRSSIHYAALPFFFLGSSLFLPGCLPCHDDDDDVTVVLPENTSPTPATPTPALPVDEDIDADGYTEEDGDCDDEDPSTYPGADEEADGLDNDCDGSVDEGWDAGDSSGEDETPWDAGDVQVTPEEGGEETFPPEMEEGETPWGEMTPDENETPSEASGDDDTWIEASPTSESDPSPAMTPGEEEGNGDNTDEPSPFFQEWVDNEPEMYYDAGSCDCDLSGKTPMSTSFMSLLFGVLSIGWIRRISRNHR